MATDSRSGGKGAGGDGGPARSSRPAVGGGRARQRWRGRRRWRRWVRLHSKQRHVTGSRSRRLRRTSSRSTFRACKLLSMSIGSSASSKASSGRAASVARRRSRHLRARHVAALAARVSRGHPARRIGRTRSCGRRRARGRRDRAARARAARSRSCRTAAARACAAARCRCTAASRSTRSGCTQLRAVHGDELICDVEAGLNGERFERELERRGYTFGHFPSSIYCSTVGGWLATRAAGQLSTKYGKVEDRVAGLTVVTGRGEVIETDGPNRALRGPNWSQLILGSEGTLGIITSRAPARVAGAAAARVPRLRGRRRCTPASRRSGACCRRACGPRCVRLYDELDTLINSFGHHEDDAPSTTRARRCRASRPARCPRSRRGRRPATRA